MSFLQSIHTYGRMIKFSHSIFALPFALSGAALAAGCECAWLAAGWLPG